MTSRDYQPPSRSAFWNIAIDVEMALPVATSAAPKNRFRRAGRSWLMQGIGPREFGAMMITSESGLPDRIVSSSSSRTAASPSSMVSADLTALPLQSGAGAQASLTEAVLRRVWFPHAETWPEVHSALSSTARLLWEYENTSRCSFRAAQLKLDAVTSVVPGDKEFSAEIVAARRRVYWTLFTLELAPNLFFSGIVLLAAN